MSEVMLLFIIKVTPRDKTLGVIFHCLGPVDYVVSNDDKYEETNEKSIKEILQALIKLFSFSKLECISGCSRLEATFTKNSLKRSTATCSFVIKSSLTLILKQLSTDPFLLQPPNCLNILQIVPALVCPSSGLFRYISFFALAIVVAVLFLKAQDIDVLCVQPNKRVQNAVAPF